MLSKCFSGSLLKSVIYVSRETIWDRVQKSILKQCLFLKREVCFTFLGQRPKTLGPPAERLPTMLIKLYITKPEKQAKQIFPCNLRFLNHFRRLSQRRSAFQQILSDKSNKTAFYVSRETFWWTTNFWNKKPN